MGKVHYNRWYGANILFWSQAASKSPIVPNLRILSDPNMTISSCCRPSSPGSEGCSSSWLTAHSARMKDSTASPASPALPL